MKVMSMWFDQKDSGDIVIKFDVKIKKYSSLHPPNSTRTNLVYKRFYSDGLGIEAEYHDTLDDECVKKEILSDFLQKTEGVIKMYSQMMDIAQATLK